MLHAICSRASANTHLPACLLWTYTLYLESLAAYTLHTATWQAKVVLRPGEEQEADLSAYAGVLRRRAALAALMLRMRMSREEQVTLGASFRLAP